MMGKSLKSEHGCLKKVKKKKERRHKVSISR